MKGTIVPAIPVSRDTAERFAALNEEQKRIVRMRVAIEVGRLSTSRSRTAAAAEFRTASAAIDKQGRRTGLSLAKIKRMIDDRR